MSGFRISFFVVSSFLVFLFLILVLGLAGPFGTPPRGAFGVRVLLNALPSQGTLNLERCNFDAPSPQFTTIQIAFYMEYVILQRSNL
jgi:hypothetical protein